MSRLMHVGWRRASAISALGLIAIAACSQNQQPTNTVDPPGCETRVERGTLGEEVYGLFCDRMGERAFPEDVCGDSFRAVCHKIDGKYADTVDDARLATLVRHRADLIVAIDATFPDVMVPVKDIANPNPAESCDRPGRKRSHRGLVEELADLLGRLQDLYLDDTLQHSSDALARVMIAFEKSPAARSAWARLDSRRGYRPSEIALGPLRAVAAYPSLRHLSSALLPLLLGSAHPQLSKALEVAREELRTHRSGAPLAPIDEEPRDGAGRIVITRPRSTNELLQKLLYAEDPAFGSGPPRYLVKRDRYGWASVRLVDDKLPAPFVDQDGDQLADRDALGRFVIAPDATVDAPFLPLATPLGIRDGAGRALDENGELVYDYIDLSHTFTARLLAELRPLVDLQAGRATLTDFLAGAHVLFGAREKASRPYEIDPGAGPRVGKPIAVEYDGFATDSSPLLDLIYALAQLTSERSSTDTLSLLRTLMTDHTATLARLVGDGLHIKAVADQHPEAKLPDTSTLWDELIDLMVAIEKEPGLLEDLLRFLGTDEAKTLARIFGSQMSFKDRISHDRANLNGTAKNFTTGVVGDPMKTPVDRAQAASGANRSALQKLVQTIHDTNGVTVCNKQGAVFHARGVPLVGNADICAGALALCSLPNTRSFHECEVFKIENFAKFYLQSILGKARIYWRPTVIRSGIAGIGAATVDTIQQSSGITGFWDATTSREFRPQPRWLNRLLNLDLADDVGTPAFTVAGPFIRDLIGDKIGTAVCAERTIDDPSPGTADASPDGKIRGLRTCQNGDHFFQRDADALYAGEQLGFYTAVTPLLKMFSDRGREDLFIRLMEVLHRHWAEGAVSYEPILAEAFASDLPEALNALSKILQTTTVKHCPAVDTTTGRCTAPLVDRNGITVVAEAARGLVDPGRATTAGLTDRAGRLTAQRNDGTMKAQITPIDLLTQALRSIDSTFAAYAQANPNDGRRAEKWRTARSQLVDQFLDVNGKNTAQASFKNMALPGITPVVIDVLRSQIEAHCRGSFVAPYPACKWAREELAVDLASVVRGPAFATAMDLVDAIGKDDEARAQLLALLSYLVDAGSPNQALPSVLAAVTDLLQTPYDDSTHVPLFEVMSEATSAVDAQLALLRPIFGKAFDEEGRQICSSEIDPNQILSVALENLVTPMIGSKGNPARTPLEVFVDVVAAVNRAAPAPDNQTKLDGADYARIADQLGNYFLDEERVLRRLHGIVRELSARE